MPKVTLTYAVGLCVLALVAFEVGSVIGAASVRAEHSEDETVWHAPPDVSYEISATATDDEVVILSGRVVMITETEVVVVSIDDNGLFDVLNRYRWREDGDAK